ncbi:Uncharacterised protein [Salmonella enterica]|nr:Uncharacterised protein [Salmonella enterica]
MIVKNYVRFLVRVSFEDDFSRATELRLNIDTQLVDNKSLIESCFQSITTICSPEKE